jgi:hypothetical protein
VISGQSDLLARNVEKARQLVAAARYCHRLTPWWHPSFLRTVRRARRVCAAGRFLPREAFRLGMFDPEFPIEDLAQFISRADLWTIQLALNPVEWQPLLRNKALFYRYCRSLGIPIPRLYAVIHDGGFGVAYPASVLGSRAEALRFLEEDLPNAFIVKPVQGAYGHGVNLMERERRGYVDAFGREFTTEGLLDWLGEEAKTTGVLLQERVFNHPEIVRLSGSRAVQTCRITTYVGTDEKARIAHTHLKTITGDEIVDTYLEGLRGNLEVPIDLASGALGEGYRILGNGEGIATLPRHPVTGEIFEGFQCPFWAESVELVRRAAIDFLPVRTIGWDVAITPGGPVVIEGNIWWDPPNEHRRWQEIAKVLEI